MQFCLVAAASTGSVTMVCCEAEVDDLAKLCWTSFRLTRHDTVCLTTAHSTDSVCHKTETDDLA